MDALYQPYKALTAGQRKLKCCIESKTVETGNRFISSRDADILVPLASDARFLPLKRTSSSWCTSSHDPCLAKLSIIALSMPIPQSLVALPPSPTMIRLQPFRTASTTNWPVP